MIKTLHRNLLMVALFLIIFISANQTYSQSIWTNPINDSSPFNFNPYIIGDVKDANITVTGIGRGSGISGNAGSGRYNAKGWTSAADIDSDDYFTFTLTPNSGYKINFVGLDFTLQRSTTGPTSFSVRSSIDNYATTIQYIASSGTTASSETVLLSGAGFQNVTNPITFRIYGYGATGATGTSSINDFTFNGQVNNALGIEGVELSKLSFYPNPVKDILNLSSEESIISVKVYTLTGQLVLSNNSEYTIEKIDFSTIPSGIYLVKATTSKGNKTKYIVKK